MDSAHGHHQDASDYNDDETDSGDDSRSAANTREYGDEAIASSSDDVLDSITASPDIDHSHELNIYPGATAKAPSQKCAVAVKDGRSEPCDRCKDKDPDCYNPSQAPPRAEIACSTCLEIRVQCQRSNPADNYDYCKNMNLPCPRPVNVDHLTLISWSVDGLGAKPNKTFTPITPTALS